MQLARRIKAALELPSLPEHYSLLRELKCVQGNEQLLTTAYKNAVKLLQEAAAAGRTIGQARAAKEGLAQAGYIADIAPAAAAAVSEPAPAAEEEDAVDDSSGNEQPVPDEFDQLHEKYMQQRASALTEQRCRATPSRRSRSRSHS